MRTIERHPVDPSTDWDRIRDTSHGLGLPVPHSLTPDRLRELYDAAGPGRRAPLAMEHAGYLAAVDPEHPALCEALRVVASDTPALLAKLTEGAGTDGAGGLGGVGGVALDRWLDGFHAGLVVRDPEALDALCRLLGERGGTAAAVEPDGDGSATVRLTAAAQRALWLGTGDAAAPAADAAASFDPRRLPDLVAERLQRLVLPQLDLALALLAADPDGFNQALAGALEAHKRYYLVGGRYLDTRGAIALAPLGLASLAHDRGLPIGVSSGYLPPRALDGARRR